MRFLAVVAGIFAILLLFMLAEAQRSFFGKESGNLLAYLEFGLILIGWLIVQLWRFKKLALGIALGCVAMAVSFAFLGWFAHPDRSYSRALERVSDWERALADYRTELSLGHGDPDAAVRLERLTRELAARRMEYRAAEIRFSGDAEFFHSGFYTCSFWFISGVFAVFGVRYLLQSMRTQA
jgi:hypothetical protein